MVLAYRAITMSDLPLVDLGPYRLTEPLGNGGMGSVFLAEDTRLGRQVAIKRVANARDHEEFQRRFRNEAATLARFSHPAIVQIYDIVECGGEAWIVMEWIRGRTLASQLEDGPLPLDEVLEIGRQIAEGLAEAHGQGILHRDLKTENVMLQGSGHAKILDFGLAKPQQQEDDESQLTATGRVLGTCRSMSPEQARGLPLDFRSDLFSLGVLMYELATGESPFKGPSRAEVLVGVLSRPHTPVAELRPDAPVALSGLIDRLLQKSPELRPHSSGDVAAKLADIARNGGHETPVGSDVDDETAIETLDFASATAENTKAVRGDLRTHRWVWAGAAALLLIAASAVWWRMPASQTGPASAPAEEQSELTAHELFENGLRRLASGEPDGLEQAVKSFETMLAMEPESAPAHAGLALAYRRQYAAHRDPVRLDQAISIAEGAVRLDDHLALTHVALGLLRSDAGDHEEAEQSLRRALQLDPSSARAWRGLGESYRRQGRFDRAFEAYGEAIRLRPDDAELQSQLGMAYYRAGRYDEAESAIDRSLELGGETASAYRDLSAIYYMQGRLVDAAAVLQRAITIHPEHSLYSNLGTVLFAQGLYPPAAQAFEKALELGGGQFYLYWANLGDAQRQMAGAGDAAKASYLQAITLLEERLEEKAGSDRLKSRLALYLAKAGQCARSEILLEGPLATKAAPAELFRHAIAREVCGERERALETLQQALAQGYPAAEVRSDPELAALRSDPRFSQLMMSDDGSDGP